MFGILIPDGADTLVILKLTLSSIAAVDATLYEIIAIKRREFKSLFLHFCTCLIIPTRAAGVQIHSAINMGMEDDS